MRGFNPNLTALAVDQVYSHPSTLYFTLALLHLGGQNQEDSGQHKAWIAQTRSLRCQQRLCEVHFGFILHSLKAGKAENAGKSKNTCLASCWSRTPSEVTDFLRRRGGEGLVYVFTVMKYGGARGKSQKGLKTRKKGKGGEWATCQTQPGPCQQNST
jgi:hypothetical protein